MTNHTYVTKLALEYIITAFMIAFGLRLLGFQVTNMNDFVYGLIGVCIIMATVPVKNSIIEWMLK